MNSSDRQVVSGEMYAGYANDEAVRAVASSGGVVSAILIHLLEEGFVDAVLVSRIASQDGQVCGASELARSKEEILQHAGSAYIDTPVVARAKDLRDFPGKVAIVALPCQARRLRRMLSRDQRLRERVACVIGLFCRGAVTRTFYEDIFRRYGMEAARVESVKVVRGHYTGDVEVCLRAGAKRTIPFATMNAYRIVGAHAKPLCLWCDEHLSVDADISVGDIFTRDFKMRPIKHSAFVCRNASAARLVSDMWRGGSLTVELVGMERYRRVFRRVERFSNDLAPRYLPAMLTGIRPVGQRKLLVDPFRCLAWTVFFGVCRLTKKPGGRRLVYGLPLPIIRLMSFAVKALSRL